MLFRSQKPFANRRHDRSILFLLDLRLAVIDPVQLNLIEPQIARRRRGVSVLIRSDIEMGLAGHDDVQRVMQGGNGEPVGRIQAGLRREQRPGADARVCSSRLEGTEKSQQQ